MGDVHMKRRQYDSAVDFFEQSLLEESSYTVKKKLKAVSVCVRL